jgi:diguanylate cyclase (GGDEF)-like protein
MPMTEKSVSTERDRVQTRVLFIGNPQHVFMDPHVLQEPMWIQCSDALEGIQMTAQRSFSIIVLELKAMPVCLGNVLKALREQSDARIILMAQIYDEPLARRFCDANSQEAIGADDYLLCPTQAHNLLPSVPMASDDQLSHFEQRLRELEKLATEDDLTGLKNRRYIWEFSRQILSLAEREHRQVTLLVYDIDDFKHYNDRYGHTTGDKILKQAAILMRRCCRCHDVVGRIGGDEFAVLFWSDPLSTVTAGQTERRLSVVDHPREVIVIARRFQRALEDSELPFLGPQGKGILTISGGLASFPRDGSTIDQLFQKADAALIEAKRRGKNRIYLVGTPGNDNSFPDQIKTL